MKELTGTGVALCTPFNEKGKVDFTALEKLVEYNITGGVSYLVALGTTAETATLNTDEKKSIVDCIKQTNANRLPLVLGVGGNDTLAVTKKINEVELNDFAAILSVSPYYNRPTQEGLYKHYKHIANNTEAKIILYNVPSRTGANMEPTTTLRLAHDFDSYVAIKDAPFHFQQYLYLLKERPKGFLVISGDDALALPALLAGAEGTISVLAQGMPSEFSKMINLGLDRQVDEAYEIYYKLLDYVDLIFEEGNPSGIKALLELKNIMASNTRLPLESASNKLKQKLTNLINH